MNYANEITRRQQEYLMFIWQYQRQHLMFIWQYQRQHRHMPTIRDIMRGMGLYSLSPVQKALDKLRDKGYIDRQIRHSTRRESYKTPRSIEFTKTIDTEFGIIPVLGVCS